MVATANNPATPVGAAPAATPAAALAAAAPDPQGDLKKLIAQAQANQSQLDQLTKDNASIKQEISILQTSLTEADQTIKNYTQGAAPIADQSGTRSFITQQSGMVQTTIGTAGKADLDTIVGGIDSDIQNQTQSVAALQTASDQAAAAQASAVKTASDKQAAYDNAKTTLARAQATVADLKNLKTQVTSAATSGNFGTMYVLLGEMTAGLGSLSLPDPATLQTQLTEAVADLHTALAAARDTKDTANSAAAALAAAQKKLSDTKTGRRAALLNAVKDWKPKAAQSVGSPSTAPAATLATPAAPTAAATPAAATSAPSKS